MDRTVADVSPQTDLSEARTRQLISNDERYCVCLDRKGPKRVAMIPGFSWTLIDNMRRGHVTSV